MPFVSVSQLRKCFQQMLQKGKISKNSYSISNCLEWDCFEWLRETKSKSLPLTVNSSTYLLLKQNQRPMISKVKINTKGQVYILAKGIPVFIQTSSVKFAVEIFGIENKITTENISNKNSRRR